MTEGLDNHKRQSKNHILEVNKEFYTPFYKHFWKRRFVFDQKWKARLFYQFVRRLNFSLEGLYILEYGFGYGNILFSLPLSSRIYGIELVPEAVKNAEVVAQRIGFVEPRFFVERGDARFPIESRLVDLVVCSHVLEHVPDDDLLLAEFRRVLKSGGHAIFLSPINEVVKDPNHIRETDLVYFQGKSARYGFEVVDSWTGDRILPYTTIYWVKHYHKKFGAIGRVGSVVLNLLFCAIPLGLFDQVEKALERAGKTPHQLAVCLRKKA